LLPVLQLPATGPSHVPLTCAGARDVKADDAAAAATAIAARCTSVAARGRRRGITCGSHLRFGATCAPLAPGLSRVRDLSNKKSPGTERRVSGRVGRAGRGQASCAFYHMLEIFRRSNELARMFHVEHRPRGCGAWECRKRAMHPAGGRNPRPCR
jgi:hypothetical protein